jgi:hypothetical protein
MRLDRSYDDSLHCATCIARQADTRTEVSIFFLLALSPRKRGEGRHRPRERRDAGDMAGFFPEAHGLKGN